MLRTSEELAVPELVSDGPADPQRGGLRLVWTGGHEHREGSDMMMKAVLTSGTHPEYGEITIPFPNPKENK